MKKIIYIFLLGLLFIGCKDESYKYRVIFTVQGDLKQKIDTCYITGVGYPRASFGVEIKRDIIERQPKNIYRLIFYDLYNNYEVYKSYNPILILEENIYEEH